MALTLSTLAPTGQVVPSELYPPLLCFEDPQIATKTELRSSMGASADMAMDLGTANTLIYVRGKGIVLPAEALVKSANGESVVWIKTGAERFLAQPVQARPLDAKTVLVVQGLAPDNRVVVQGASLLNQIR